MKPTIPIINSGTLITRLELFELMLWEDIMMSKMDTTMLVSTTANMLVNFAGIVIAVWRGKNGWFGGTGAQFVCCDITTCTS